MDPDPRPWHVALLAVQVIAVVSYGFSGTCHGADYSWRVDTQESYDFILPFLGG